MGQLSKKDAQIGQMDGMVRSVEDEMRRIRGEVKQRQESEEQMRSVSFHVQQCMSRSVNLSVIFLLACQKSHAS